jgi:hypothetical protein
MEAKRLQSLVERAAALDRELTEEADLDAEDDDPSPPVVKTARGAPSRAAKLAAARQEAMRMNKGSFVFEGETYVEHKSSKGKSTWRRVGGTKSRPTGPCVKFRNDPIGCNAEPECTYAIGKKRQYCAEARGFKKTPIANLGMPVATGVPITNAPIGMPVTDAVAAQPITAVVTKAKALPKLKPIGM